MSAAFDPYHKWLGIPPAEQPPNCYRLLGIRDFEDDPEVIDAAADQRMRHLRSFQTSKQAVLSNKLLNEVAQARRRLLDPEEREEYNAQLREQQGSSNPSTRGAKAGASPTRVASAGVAQKATWTEGKAPVTLAEFMQCVAVSRILTADEVQKFVAALPEGKKTDTPKALATELAKAGKVTKYQAQGLLQGKLKYLAFGEYLILDKLGQGGMGQVLKAEHRRMRRTVALKVISSSEMKNADAVRRFQREVHAAARLIHSNIVTAFDANEHQGVHFFVMEYVEGKDLGEVVRAEGPLAVASAADYVCQAARGLAYAHGKGIVHRDIKPANLLLDGEGTVKILDMGLARIDLGADDGHELTNTGQVMGTVDYMAPEQAEDTHTADARADIYSLGCTLYRLLVGEVLYTGDSMMKKLLAHRGAPIPSLLTARPDVPAALDAIFQKMVAKQAQDRQQTMTQVVAELDSFLRGERPSFSSSGNAPEAPHNAEFSEFLAGMKTRGSKSSTAIVSKKEMTVATAASEVTQDFRSSDTDATIQLPAQSAALLSSVPVPDAEAPSQPKPTQEISWFAKNRVAVLIAAVLGGLALVAAGIVLFLPTADGTIRVEINDPSIEVTVGESGYTIKGKTEEVRIKPGEHTLHVKTGELEFDTQKFVLGKGENPAVKVELLPGAVQVVNSDGKKLGEKRRPWSNAARATPATPAPVSSGTASSGGASSASGDWISLFSGTDLNGWLQKGHAGWSVKDGVMTGESVGAVGWLMNSREFGDFELELEYRLPAGGNSGVFFRAPETGAISGSEFHEVQLLDDTSTKYVSVDPKGRTGALFGQTAPTKSVPQLPNAWHRLSTRVFGQRLQVSLEGTQILDGQLPEGRPEKGHIGLQLYAPGVSFRNIRVREISSTSFAAGASSGGRGVSSLAFEGAGAVRVPTLSRNEETPVTLECWCQVDARNQFGAILALGGKEWFGISQNPRGGCYLVTQRIPSSTARPTRPLQTGEWGHLAAVVDGREGRFYLNGKLLARTPLTDTIEAHPNPPPGELTIGASLYGPNLGSYMIGQMRAVRVTNGARYRADFTPPERFTSDKDTLALYHFDENQGDILKDSSGNNHHGRIVGAKWVEVDGPK